MIGEYLPVAKTDTPSQVRNQYKYWIHAENPGAVWGKSPGKWLLFISKSRLDAAWFMIERETKIGQLGVAAKASTSKPNSLASSPSAGLICIYTYDSGDLDDVRRVRQRLRELGFKRKIPYKTDAETSAGRYAAHGDKNVSMLFE